MKPLTLDKALQLYDLIGEYVPEVDDDNDAIKFIGTIVRNIKESGNHRAYVDAVSLMSGKPMSELLKLQYDEVLKLFVHGLAENKIISLQAFCKEVGYDARGS